MRIDTARRALPIQLARANPPDRALAPIRMSQEVSAQIPSHPHREVNQQSLQNADCYICLEPFDGRENILWCKAQCGKNVHRRCFQRWAEMADGNVMCGHWWVFVSSCFCLEMWWADFDGWVVVVLIGLGVRWVFVLAMVGVIPSIENYFWFPLIGKIQIHLLSSLVHRSLIPFWHLMFFHRHPHVILSGLYDIYRGSLVLIFIFNRIRRQDPKESKQQIHSKWYQHPNIHNGVNIVRTPQITTQLKIGSPE